ncbi:MAG: hypothetical protein WCO06_06585 [Candidatus Roizmanbacteria bacterium]
MTYKKKRDPFELVYSFRKTILENKPTVDQMYDELRMMNFKIKPVQGDVAYLNLKNDQFIELLWSLGKLDEFYQSNYDNVASKQKDVFYRLFDEMYQRFQSELNQISLHKGKSNESASGFEVEIFKDRSVNKN